MPARIRVCAGIAQLSEDKEGAAKDPAAPDAPGYAPPPPPLPAAARLHASDGPEARLERS